MAYLEFTKQEVNNLPEALKKEYIRTNRAGSYASSTIVNCNTRKYHGLLVCPLPEIDKRTYLLLSSLDETVIQHNTPFRLAIHKFPVEYSPLGHKYMESFSNDPIPTFVYRVGGVTLKKEIILIANERQVLIKYTLLKATSKTTLQLRPFLAFRKVHELTHVNYSVNTHYVVKPQGVSVKMYAPFPELNLQLSKKNEFVSAPDWWHNFEYAKEQERGFEFHEDLYTPGYFEFDIKEGETVVFSASLKEVKPKELSALFEKEVHNCDPNDSYEHCLVNSARQFLLRENGKTRILASLPWSGDWGRDAMVALPGLTLMRGAFDTCEEVLNTFTKEISGNVYASVGNIEHANVESIDTALWYIRSVQQFNWNTKDIEKTRKLYAAKVEEILEVYMSGANNDVVMHENGLLYLPNPHKALTWVDAVINGVPLIKRYGYVVEVNALWYNSICFALELIPKKSFQTKWKHIPARIEKSFVEIFWSEELGYLADTNVNGYQDFTVRPSQIFGASLPFSTLNDVQRKSVLNVVRKELLTPKGIRTLTPQSPDFIGAVVGSIDQRARAYHQGGVLLWLLAPYAEAYLKLHGHSGVAEVKRMYQGLEEEMFLHGVGTMSEVYDGNPPHTPRGAISQAMSVAAVLRLKKLIENFEKDTL
ncbi:MAG: amylo-alpha-1,6-glucosidase [Bacteroidales bacterium]|nr:amylo-alpha-1,6-glucosidase [Bacteroidales bacterium]